jgi:hypothetical protein
MGYCTIDLVLAVPPALKDAARTWLQNNYDGNLEPRAIIRTTDPDDAPARFWVVELRVTPQMYTTIKTLAEKPQFATAKLRASLRGSRKDFRRELKAELAESGMRLKP